MTNDLSSKLVAQSIDVTGDENFLQGCSFSPDGLCVLTASVADSQLRLYNTPLQPRSSPSPTGLPLDDGKSAALSGSDNSATSITDTDWKTVLSANGGDTLRCYTWYPGMASSDPSSCCFLAAARDLPVHLYDAYNGAVRATYRPFNGLDEMESPSVVEFSRDGQKILCGGFRTDRTIHIFDTATPGRDSTVLRLGKTRRSSDGQKGLVSSACFGGGGAGQQDLLAVGTYSPGSIYVYDFRAGQQPSGTIVSGLCVVGHGKGHSKKKRRFVSASFVDNTDTNECENEAQNDDNWFSAAKVKWFQSKAQGGVTQMMFAPNEDYTLYSASRRSNAVIAWDLRMLSCDPSHQSNPVRGLASFATVSDTNQRLEFDIDKSGEMLFVGCQDECVRVYNLKTGKILATFDGIGGVVNGVSHAFVDNRSLLTVAVGSRQFAPLDTLENDPSRTTFDTSGASCLRLMEITRSK